MDNTISSRVNEQVVYGGTNTRTDSDLREWSHRQESPDVDDGELKMKDLVFEGADKPVNTSKVHKQAKTQESQRRPA